MTKELTPQLVRKSKCIYAWVPHMEKYMQIQKCEALSVVQERKEKDYQMLTASIEKPYTNLEHYDLFIG